MLSFDQVIRMELGYYTYQDRKIVICGYLVNHQRGPLLLDTGIGGVDEETAAAYRPVGWSLEEALRRHGVRPADIGLVVNCHLHADHCGANPLFPGTPIFAQRREYEAAREPGYTTPELVDFDGAKYELIDGEAEPLPGVRIVPTPGHTPGHQSLVLETGQGTVVIAGQAFNTTSEFSEAQFAWRLASTGVEESFDYPPWIARLQEFDPRRVLFAHDLAIWQPDTR